MTCQDIDTLTAGPCATTKALEATDFNGDERWEDWCMTWIPPTNWPSTGPLRGSPGATKVGCRRRARVTVYALSRYLRLLEEESRQPFDYEVAAAKAQFDAALATLRSEPCRSRSDHRAKHLALDLLASAFPYDDCRISELNRSVVEDMIRLFEVEVSRALAPGALAYSGRVDLSAAE